jgi:hypothetical protein
MKFRFLIILLLCSLTGCSHLFKNDSQKQQVYGPQILSLVKDALNGNAGANDSLSKLIDMKLPLSGNYNQVSVDSIQDYANGRIYFVLLEHPIPTYNRFAIYGGSGRCYLLDKSLDGNLKTSVYKSGGGVFIQVEEDFVSKDDLQLVRKSLYLVSGDTASLAFRDFSELKNGKKSFIQNIESFTKDSISTAINFGKTQDADVFVFDRQTLKYTSRANKFQKTVLDEINNYGKIVIKPQIVDEQSALEAAGVKVKRDSVQSINNFQNDEDGFSLYIPEEWKVIKNFNIPGNLKIHAKGTYFLNNSKGARFYVVKIAQGDSAESYVNYPFSNFVKGKYTVRFTEKIITGNNLYLYFEISCKGKNFLLFFEMPKLVYEENKPTFQSIINSFEINA